MEGRDRRSCPRFEGNFEVDLLNLGDDPSFSIEEAIVPAHALDISKHGMRLQSSYNVSVGSVVSVIAYYQRVGSICLCEVVWKRDQDGMKVYGLYVKKWSKMDPLLRQKLDDMEAKEINEREKDTTPTGKAVVTKYVPA